MFNELEIKPRIIIGETISTMELGKKVSEYLLDKGIQGFIGAKVHLSKQEIKVTIAMNPNSKMIEVNPIAKLNTKIKVKEPYTITNELKNILYPIINNDPTVDIFAGRKSYDNDKIIIHLVPAKVLNVILAKPKEGYEYKITKVIPQKAGAGFIEFSQIKIGNNKKKNNKKKTTREIYNGMNNR